MSNGTRFKSLDSEGAALNPNNQVNTIRSSRNTEDVTVNGERNAKALTPNLTFSKPNPYDPGGTLQNPRVTRRGTRRCGFEPYRFRARNCKCLAQCKTITLTLTPTKPNLNDQEDAVSSIGVTPPKTHFFGGMDLVGVSL